MKYNTWCNRIDDFFHDLSMEIYYDHLEPSDYPNIMDYLNKKQIEACKDIKDHNSAIRQKLIRAEIDGLIKMEEGI